MLLYWLKSKASVFGAWNMDVCFLNSTNGYYVALILISFSWIHLFSRPSSAAVWQDDVTRLYPAGVPRPSRL